MDVPHLHLGILVPVDPEIPHHVIGWDQPGELVPLLLGEIGCEYLDGGLTLHTPTETLRVYTDDAGARRYPANHRATAISRAIAQTDEPFLAGPAVFVGGTVTSVGDVNGLSPAAYVWLDHALSLITGDALRAAAARRYRGQ